MIIPQDLASPNRTQLERWISDHCKTVPVSENIVLARVLNKYLMYLDMRDKSVAPHLAMNGYWEMWITQFCARYLKPGMVAFDVGANVGYYSVLFADLVGPAGLVQAFDPQAEIYPLITKTLEVNGFSDRLNKRVTFHASAVSTSESLSLKRYPGNYGSASCHAYGVRSEAVLLDTTSLVDTIRLDSLMPAHFVKVDVEGHEPEVWKSMEGWRAAGKRPAVLLEWSAMRYDANQFLDQIQVDGYKIELINEMGQIAQTTRDHLLGVGEELEMLWLTPTA